jgi:hypothetical protein
MEFPKKRGRKPKGGKIVECFTPLADAQVMVQNVVLHLRCRISEIHCVNPEEIEPFIPMEAHALIEEPCDDSSIYTKLKSLAVNLHKNDIGNHKSDCFWCTCPFETPAVHIPKCKTGGTYVVYGSFCTPECAAAYLIGEPRLDNSTRHERFHLLSTMYCPIYGKQNIIPAPPPHYLLSKFCGKLSAVEFRRLIGKETVAVLDKPISFSYPELMLCQPVQASTEDDHGYRLCRKKKS